MIVLAPGLTVELDTSRLEMTMVKFIGIDDLGRPIQLSLYSTEAKELVKLIEEIK